MFNIIDHKSSYKADFNDPEKMNPTVKLKFTGVTKLIFLTCQFIMYRRKDLLIQNSSGIRRFKSA